MSLAWIRTLRSGLSFCMILTVSLAHGANGELYSGDALFEDEKTELSCSYDISEGDGGQYALEVVSIARQKQPSKLHTACFFIEHDIDGRVLTIPPEVVISLESGLDDGNANTFDLVDSKKGVVFGLPRDRLFVENSRQGIALIIEEEADADAIARSFAAAPDAVFELDTLEIGESEMRGAFFVTRTR
ncbi:MAG: hypothetical protein AAF871_04410 [Pseudomonadota bacterium]